MMLRRYLHRHALAVTYLGAMIATWGTWGGLRR